MSRNFTLEVNGVPVPYSFIHYKRLAPFGSGPCDVTLPYRATVVGEHTLVVKEDAVTKWSGKIYDFDFPKGKDGVFTRLYGSSLEKKHSSMDMNARTYKGARGHNILKDDLGNTDLTEGTMNDPGTNIDMEFGDNDENIWNRRDAWFETALVDDFEIYVSPAGAVDYKAACGVNRGKTPAVSTTRFAWGENITKWIIPDRYDHKQKAGCVKVIGRKESVYQAYGIAGAGLPVRKFHRKNLHTMETCASSAVAIHGDMQNALNIGQFECVDEGSVYDVYDTVWVYDEDLGLDADKRVYEIERWISSEKIIAQIKYTTLSNLTVNGPLLLDRGTFELEKGQEALLGMAAVPFTLKETNFLSKYSGEYTGGYAITQAGGATVTVKKDYLTLQTGTGTGQGIIQSNDQLIDFSVEPSFDLRFKINDIDDPVPNRAVWLGFWNSGTSKGIYVYIDGFSLTGVTQDGVGQGGGDILDGGSLSVDIWYRVCAFLRNGKVYWYVNGKLMRTTANNVPTTGTSTSLYIQQYAAANPGARNFIIYIDTFEVYQKYA